MISKRKRNRILSFLLILIIVVLLLIINNLTIKIILLATLLIYAGFIIFLRDTFRFGGKIDIDDLGHSDQKPKFPLEVDEGSFTVVSKSQTGTKNNNISENLLFPNKFEKLTPPDLKIKFEEIINESISSELDNEGKFSFALEKILAVINDVFHPYSVMFFWYDSKNKKLSINKYLSISNDILLRKLDLEDDILSKIIKEQEPKIISNILPNAEIDNIRYYQKPQGILSFIGVPVYYENKLIAILAMDSTESDVYGVETIYSLGRIVRVITLLIQTFDERYRANLSQKRFNSLLNFLNSDFESSSNQNIIDSIIDLFNGVIEWDVFSIVYYNLIDRKYQIIATKNKTNLKYLGVGFEIDLIGTLVGKAINKNIPIKIDEIGIKKEFRYRKSEDISSFDCFLAVPISFRGSVLGAYCFESLKKNHFSKSDIKFIESISKFTAYLIHNINSQLMMERLITIDIETNVLNGNEFKKRLSEEILKANSVNANGILALIKIDDFVEQSNLFEGDPFPKVLKHIVHTIKNELLPRTIIGRLNERIFAVYFFNYEMKNVFIWAEKLRQMIARSPILIDGRENTYTISIGLCSTKTKNNSDIDNILETANLALIRAVEKQGNKVVQGN